MVHFFSVTYEPYGTKAPCDGLTPIAYYTLLILKKNGFFCFSPYASRFTVGYSIP